MNHKYRNLSKKLQAVASVLFLLLLIAAIGFSIWKIVLILEALLIAVDPSVATAVIGSSTTSLVSIGVALYTQTQIKKREIEEAHRSHKVEIYKELLHQLGELIFNQRDSDAPQISEDLVKFINKHKTDVILWDSPKVVKAHLHFQEVSGMGTANVLLAVDELYKAIREDIGLSNKGLNKQELIKMYLRNPTELDTKILNVKQQK